MGSSGAQLLLSSEAYLQDTRKKSHRKSVLGFCHMNSLKYTILVWHLLQKKIHVFGKKLESSYVDEKVLKVYCIMSL